MTKFVEREPITDEEYQQLRWKVIWTDSQGVELTAHVAEEDQAREIAEQVGGEVYDVHSLS
jgi:hypothetical protein